MELGPEALTLTEDGQEHEVAVERLVGEDLEVMLVIDSSGSMTGVPIEATRAAARPVRLPPPVACASFIAPWHAHACRRASRCYGYAMRTTVTLESDVAAAVERLRQADDVGVSEAVNRLIRAGLLVREQPAPYVHETRDLGLKVDVSNIGEVLDLLDDA